MRLTMVTTMITTMTMILYSNDCNSFNSIAFSLFSGFSFSWTLTLEGLGLSLRLGAVNGLHYLMITFWWLWFKSGNQSWSRCRSFHCSVHRILSSRALILFMNLRIPLTMDAIAEHELFANPVDSHCGRWWSSGCRQFGRQYSHRVSSCAKSEVASNWR